RGMRASGGLPHTRALPQVAGQLKDAAVTLQAVRSAIDQLAGLEEIASRQGRAGGARTMGKEARQQQGGDLGGVGQIGLAFQVDAQGLTVAMVVGASGQLHKTAALVAGAIALLRVAQAGPPVVGAEGALTRTGVVLRRQFGYGQKALRLGTDGAQG